MIDNQELPIGFTMELAEHPDVLRKFSLLFRSGLCIHCDAQLVLWAKSVRK